MGQRSQVVGGQAAILLGTLRLRGALVPPAPAHPEGTFQALPDACPSSSTDTAIICYPPLAECGRRWLLPLLLVYRRQSH